MSLKTYSLKNEEEVGFCSRVCNRIDMHNYEPFKQRHRMIPPSLLDEVRSHLQQLLVSGVIRRSQSLGFQYRSCSTERWTLAHVH